MPLDSSSDTIQVKFTTRIPSYQQLLPNTIFTVPLSLTRKGLSEIVNHLLDLKSHDEDTIDEQKQKPFDFLLSNKFLTTDLQTHITRHNLSLESVLELEAILSLPESETQQQEHPDWISSLKSFNRAILSASYDSILRLVTPNEVLVEGIGHSAALKCVETIKDKIITSGIDRTVRLWELDEQNQKFECLAVSSPSEKSVECLASLENSTKFASAGYDSFITLWDSVKLIDAVENDENIRKKRKVLKPIKIFEPLNKLRSHHTQCINSLIWPHSSIIYSTSNDGFLISQSENGSILKKWQVKYHSLTKATYSETKNLIACGSSDCRIRLFDPRMNEENQEAQIVLKSHTNTVSSAKFNPFDDHIFASVSFDKTIKLWDMRSNLPLSTINLHTAQLFDCEWINSDNDTETILATGGADKQLRFHKWKSSATEQSQWMSVDTI